MRDFDVGRIFWKEWRAQRSFWLGIFGLAIGLELLLLCSSSFWQRLNPIDHLRFHQGLVMVLACSFATASAAIAFAGEVEAKTKGLLQRIPVRSRDLLAGKLSLSLIGSYALWVALWFIGGLMVLRATQTDLPPAVSADLARESSSFWAFLLAPPLFVVVGALFSLIMSDVLLTVLIAGLSAAALSAVPFVRDDLWLQVAIIVVVAGCDLFLVRRWLQSVGGAKWLALPQVTLPQFGIRRSATAIEPSIARESVRSPVAWRRAAGSLMWKEFRQAFPFCLAILLVGLIALALIPLTKLEYWSQGSGIISVILIMFAALLPGVAAVRSERKNGVFRLLAHHGVAPDGFLICKHLVWLTLSLSVFGVLLIVDRFYLANLAHPDRAPSLWNSAADVAESTFQSTHGSVIAPLAISAFHVVLMYALGFFFALLLPGPVLGFFSGAAIWCVLAFCWEVIAFLRVPFWWTIGLFPVIFLAAAWVRTPDWLIGRNTASAWCKVAAVACGPFLAILIAVAIFRVTEIPAVVVPEVVLESGPVPAAQPAVGKRSLFVDAMDALSGYLPSDESGDQPSGNVLQHGWSFAREAEEVWVNRNQRALNLALEAAGKEPGTFPLQSAADSGDAIVELDETRRLWSLANLLLYSARKMESEDRLDSALSCYIAVARLGSDVEHSGRVAREVYADGYTFLALNWMHRWAAHPQQSADRIKKAVVQFERFEGNAVPRSAGILWSWRFDRRSLRKAIWGRSTVNRKNQTVSEIWWMRWFFPWEMLRLERLTDAIFASALDELQTVKTDLANQGFVTMTADRVNRWDRSNAAPWKYWQTTLAPPEIVQLPYWGPEKYVNRLATERMNLISLAIVAFKHEHKTLPDSLQSLVPAYFSRMPIDPWSGSDFVYERRGFPTNLEFEGGWIDQSRPFLASVGMLDSHLVRLPKTPNEVVSRFASTGKERGRASGIYFPGPIVMLP